MLVYLSTLLPPWMRGTLISLYRLTPVAAFKANQSYLGFNCGILIRGVVLEIFGTLQGTSIFRQWRRRLSATEMAYFSFLHHFAAPRLVPHIKSQPNGWQKISPYRFIVMTCTPNTFKIASQQSFWTTTPQQWLQMRGSSPFQTPLDVANPFYFCIFLAEWARSQ